MDTDGKKLAVFGVCAGWGSRPAMPRRIRTPNQPHGPPRTTDLLHQPATNHSAILLLVFKCVGKPDMRLDSRTSHLRLRTWLKCFRPEICIASRALRDGMK